MRIGVTGATGFVGAHFCAAARAQGHAITALVRTPQGAPGEVVIGDLETIGDHPPPLPPLDAVVHLAARAHVMNDDPAQAERLYTQANVEGTRGALALAQAAGARRFVFVSSIKVNGERTQPGHPFTASDTPVPEDAYGRSKLAAENLVRQSGLSTTILRPPLIYGPGMKGNLPLLYKLANAKIPLPLGSVTNVRSMVHVGNLADLILLCTHSDKAHNALFLAGDGTALSTPALIRLMAEAGGNRALLWPFPVALLKAAGAVLRKRDMVERLVGSLEVDVRGAFDGLGWVPVLAAEDALRGVFGE